MLLSAAVLLLFMCAAAVLVSRKIAAESALAAVYERTETIKQPIEHVVQEVKSYANEVGFRTVQRPGADGVRELTFAVKTRGDAVELERTQLDEVIVKEPVAQVEVVGARLPNALTKAKSAQIFTDSKGVAHRETYYDLPMNVVMGACGAGGVYTVREDGAKIDKDVYVIVAANYGNYPRCSVVETSMGPGKVYDTGGFAAVHPHGFDLATDWTNGDGR